MTPDVVTAGETMLLGVPTRPGRLRHARTLELMIGGAESNVAIALSRLGISAAWVSALGADETGQLVLDRIRGEGVDTSMVRRLSNYPTGLYLRDYVGAKARAYYYRRGSAASTLAPEAFDPGFLDGTHFLHLTAITPALSRGCAEFVRWVAGEARARGARVSLDVNYRSLLWAPEEARSFVEEVLPRVDLLFVGDEEARALWSQGGEDMIRGLSERGPREVILKRGSRGCLALVGEGVETCPAFEMAEVDPVGAGDAFVAGYLAGHLWGLELAERLRAANAMGALSVATLGDYEGLPGREELLDFLEGRERLGR